MAEELGSAAVEDFDCLFYADANTSLSSSGVRKNVALPEQDRGHTEIATSPLMLTGSLTVCTLLVQVLLNCLCKIIIKS